MLVLTRHIGQSIMIGDDIRLEITGISGTQVKIAFEAPKNIPINREEIYERLQESGETFTKKGHNVNENKQP